MNEIDFVILWVDGNDPRWREEFRRMRQAETDDASPIRYRDWDNLRYWFRGVERFAPWVRRIHFVTWGHLPAWLQREHPKLHIVEHRDFIPAQYRPTFNSNVIELNLHRIEGLAEQFVLFNDDTFLLRPCRPEDFFRRGLPCDMARLSVVQSSSVGHITYNNLELINRRHNKKQAIRHHPGKWFSPCYGVMNLLKSATLMPWAFFPGLYDSHMPQPYLTARFRQAWEQWPQELDATCRHHFRSLTDLSHWLIRYDVLADGEFTPRSMRDCRLTTLADDTIEGICSEIAGQRWRMVCLNDGEWISDFERMKKQLNSAFERILPGKSSYEV